jgi:hypothetical protein
VQTARIDQALTEDEKAAFVVATSADQYDDVTPAIMRNYLNGEAVAVLVFVRPNPDGTEDIYPQCIIRPLSEDDLNNLTDPDGDKLSPTEE